MPSDPGELELLELNEDGSLALGSVESPGAVFPHPDMRRVERINALNILGPGFTAIMGPEECKSKAILCKCKLRQFAVIFESMTRARKVQPTLDSVFFSTPEQKVLRLLLSEPTTTFTPRVISSKLKGVRGLGGAEGISKILLELQALGLVDFVDNHRAVRLQDDGSTVQLMKKLVAVCDLENLRALVEPASTKGILFGSRSTGKARSDSDYDLFIVSETPEEVKKITSRHPLGKLLELVVWTPEQYEDIEQRDSALAQKLSLGIVLWGSTW